MPGRPLWEDLYARARPQVEIELAKQGTRLDYLVRALRDADDPELPSLEGLSDEALERLALRYFGDEGHPQPATRPPPPGPWFSLWGPADADVGSQTYGDITPAWGRLPELQDEHRVAPQLEGTAKQRRSTRGRRDKAVSVNEANLAAGIYMSNAGVFDVREDKGAYAVHYIYTLHRDDNPDRAWLSRPMVGHLLAAIRQGRIEWDAEAGELRIPDEFRTSPGMFVVPRLKPA